MVPPRNLNDLTAWAASVLRLGRGYVAHAPAERTPEQPLELYEFEGCPFCRKAREAFSELDLPYISRTTPKGERVKRARVTELGGQLMFPFLVDPNTGWSGNESEDIITYLHTTYGGGRSLVGRALAPLNTAGSILASGSRIRGNNVHPGSEDRVQPEQLLELWSFEASPYCRKAREALCVLNLDYVCHNVAKRGRRRPELVALGGTMQVPYLIDPNTGTSLYESDDIVDYLFAAYG